LLESSPTDAEAWAEISDLYAGQGLYQQSIFALEEVLLITPNAWNVSHASNVSYNVLLINYFKIHARLGEVLYMAAAGGDVAAEKSLAESLRRFSRSVELCDDYLRGYYGLKLVSSRIRKW
jgi:tetratricopeptide (TPR) repeat protein